MNIGDKVRMVHGREEGIIVGFTKNHMIEVEIEDGFRIPMLRSEIVIISQEEAARFQKNPVTEPIKNTSRDVLADRGIFLAFIPLNDIGLALYLINNTDFDMPYTLGQEQNGKYKGIKGGSLARKSSVKIDEYSSQNFESWGVFVWQSLLFREGMTSLREPMLQRIRFRANTFFKTKAKAPLLGKDAHLFQLDTPTASQPVTIQPDKIVESWENNTQLTTNNQSKANTVNKPASEIDLHIEKLTTNLIGLATAEMLQIQLQAFEKALDAAIAHGMHDITFIHGVGNGTLRNEIHRKLGKNVHVQYYEDAQKEKFGYGATKVKLK
ncbi:DUF2027 domain-containing protein [Xanthocytophaga agilis]|uniref:DUF2027 domain-containing protein n=1 Tax=Xanthocytophaga agilis TaxID=3048010 RepID=A0AAE3UGI2_9BACT|nr:DUF2027 domain-containing protein [Xanthocytophaga agilis]MDJ1502502.1 DUF2027 domain-containing protein [Xanthocytophaga agilis]